MGTKITTSSIIHQLYNHGFDILSRFRTNVRKERNEDFDGGSRCCWKNNNSLQIEAW